jgi:pyruvate formate lyase activating enzyme
MTNGTEFKEAVLWEKADDNKLKCFLCSHRCTVAEGNTGYCGVRKNIDGVLYSLVYDKVCSANADPIEKKPLFHFQPGTQSFSIATPGCNFRCVFCQNWQISQMALEQGYIEGKAYAPEDIVKTAVRTGCKSIAYTYTEPTIFMEICADCGKLAKKEGLANVFVSNGYQTTEAIEYARPWLDAINIDLKAFTEEFYKSFCKARLKPVLDTIRYIAKHTDIWMEITTLIIPGENDSPQELKNIAEFIVNEAGPDVPWHVSRFHPTYQMDNKSTTPEDSLQQALNAGKQAGLRYVYVGNLPGSRAESTFCHSCSELLIERVGYRIIKNDIKDGNCPKCGTQIAGFGLDQA